MEGIIIGSVVGLIVGFIIAIAAAGKFAAIAEMKGHGRSPWFGWCFWCGIVGWLMVIALPDRAVKPAKTAQPPKTVVNDELPEL